MTTYVQNFLKFQPLLKELIARDIKVKYRKSVLGVLWTLLNPLFMMIVLSVVFSNLFKFDVEYFPVYLLSGQLIFNFYSEVTTCSMSAIIDNGPLIKKVYVPKYLFILARTFSSTINLLASFTALIVVMLAMRVELHYISITGMDSTGIYCSVFTGNGIAVISDCCKIQRYYASVFGICYSTDVSDTGNLSDVNLTGVVKTDCITQSTDEYIADVPWCNDV